MGRRFSGQNSDKFFNITLDINHDTLYYSSMYIRKSTSKYKDKTYTNYLLVESVATAKGPRQKVICSLGDLSPRPKEEWLKLARKIENALTGQEELLGSEDSEVSGIVRKARQRNLQRSRKESVRAKEEGEKLEDDLVAVHTDRVTTERMREAGPVHVGYQFWQRLKLDDILAEAGLNDRSRLLSCAMTLARLIHPCSEHAMPDWIRRTALEDLLGVEFESLAEDSLYRNMDKLFNQRNLIESMLAKEEQTLFNLERTVLLYDVTSTYFEGQALANGKAKRGYSRDKRPDCKQVLVGLAINQDGFPLAHEVMDGNKPDRQTLGTILDALENRVGLEPGQCVVVDRGMAFDDNLEEIRSRGLHYIVATRQSERDDWLEEFQDLEGFEEVVREPSPLNPAQKKPVVLVKMKRTETLTYVLCISKGRKEKDRAIRVKHEEKLLRDLEKLGKRIETGKLVDTMKTGEAIGRLKERYPRVARYYQIQYDAERKELRFEPDEQKRGKAEQLDGSYLLKTDRTDITADQAWRIYSMLTRAENAFRDMKSPLAERPIYHHLTHRVETHIFLCVLAYHLLVSIETTLLRKGSHTSWHTVREALTSHQINTIVLPADRGMVLRIRKGSTPEPEQVELYRLLEVPIQVIQPRKAWSES
jgi:transposase